MSSKRGHLIDVALDLFYERGYHATSVDDIIQAAGVAKMTLYNNFGSKQDLVIAAMRRRDEQFRAALRRAIAQRDTAEAKLLAAFDLLDEFIVQRDFNGCIFINTAGEFNVPDHPVHRLAAEHKRMVCELLIEEASRAGARDPTGVAEQLMLIFDGALVTAQVSGVGEVIAHSQRLAQLVVSSALGDLRVAAAP